MQLGDAPDEATMAEYLAMMRADGVADEQSLSAVAGLTGEELRLLMEQQRREEPVPEDGDLERLLRLRSDPRALAAALPRARSQGMGAGVALLIGFCAVCLAVALVLPFVLAGPVVGAVAVVGAAALYLAARPAVKRLGVLSAGSFTVDGAGVVRAIAGVGWARRRARRAGGEAGPAGRFGVAAVFLLLVLGVPVAVAVGADLPEVMLGWMVMAMLAFNEMPLLALRTRRDMLRRSAEALDPEFGLALAADYLRRGGDADRLAEGVGLEALAPSDEGEFVSLMQDAFLRRSLTQLIREEP